MFADGGLSSRKTLLRDGRLIFGSEQLKNIPFGKDTCGTVNHSSPKSKGAEDGL
jgi:hypothetical protein